MDENFENLINSLGPVDVSDKVRNLALESSRNFFSESNKQFEEVTEKLHREKEADRANAILQTKLLQKIESNTNWIASAVNLLAINSDYQVKTLDAIQEILALSLLTDVEQVNQNLQLSFISYMNLRIITNCTNSLMVCSLQLKKQSR